MYLSKTHELLIPYTPWICSDWKRKLNSSINCFSKYEIIIEYFISLDICIFINLIHYREHHLPHLIPPHGPPCTPRHSIHFKQSLLGSSSHQLLFCFFSLVLRYFYTEAISYGSLCCSSTCSLLLEHHSSLKYWQEYIRKSPEFVTNLLRRCVCNLYHGCGCCLS